MGLPERFAKRRGGARAVVRASKVAFAVGAGADGAVERFAGRVLL